MDPLNVLKELSELLNSNNLPKELLKKMDLDQRNIEDVFLAYDYNNLCIAFSIDNGYDASHISYKKFDEVIPYLNKG